MKRSRGAFLVTLALIPLAACSSKHEQAAATNVRTAPVRIIATDSAYVAPDSLPSGRSHVAFENHGSTIHEVMFIKLPAGMSPDDYVAAVKAGSDFPHGGLDYSGVGLTSPGRRADVWINLPPGRYVLACWFRDHITTRPLHTLVVRDTLSSEPAPDADTVLKLIDSGLELSRPIAKGDQVLRVQAVDPSMHEVDIFRLGEGKTADDLRAWESNGMAGPVPGVAIGGILDSHDIGRTVWFKTTFEPGRYVMWCGLPTGADGAGSKVVREFEVKK